MKRGLDPGPGSHGSRTVSTFSKNARYWKPIREDVDNRGSNEAQRQNVNMMASSLRNAGSYSFGKAKDRFANPTEKVKAPAPDAYNIAGSIGVDRFKNSPY
jgi:hypothetical protein